VNNIKFEIGTSVVVKDDGKMHTTHSDASDACGLTKYRYGRSDDINGCIGVVVGAYDDSTRIIYGISIIDCFGVTKQYLVGEDGLELTECSKFGHRVGDRYKIPNETLDLLNLKTLSKDDILVFVMDDGTDIPAFVKDCDYYKYNTDGLECPIYNFRIRSLQKITIDTSPAVTKIDPDKEYQTKSGKGVTIVTVEGRDNTYPVIGYIGNDTHLAFWSIDGQNSTNDDNDNLVEVKEKKTAWLNIYTGGRGGVFTSYSDTLLYAGNDLVARVKVVYEDGQFDDEQFH
jgi:hypothetical protein